MKRFIALFLSICLTMCLILSTAQAAIIQVKKSQYQITNEYYWNSSRYYYYAFSLKNTSGYNANITVNAIFYDAKNNIIGVSKQSEVACENGYETYWCFYNEEKFDHVSTTISLKEDTRYEAGGQSSINLTVNKVGNKKVILIAENIGKEAVEFLEYNILFLDANGEVLSTTWGYLTSNSEGNIIAPGEIKMCEEKYSKGFSDVRVDIHGRID